jgi:hypothetical protein
MPRTLAQNAQYIAETIKPAIKSAIEAQGVTVPSTDSFLDYADRIGEISGGGSGYQLKDLPTGAISTVSDAAPLPLNALKVSVEAWQEGSGDPSPSNIRPIHGWDSGEITVCQKNRFNKALLSDISSTLQYKTVSIPNGTYTMSTPDFEFVDGIANLFVLAGEQTAGASSQTNGVTKTTPITVTITDKKITYAYRTGSTNPNNPINFNWQLEKGTQATAFAPFNGQIISQQFPQTIYGAEWNVVDGGLSVTDGYIASYNGETLPSTWISDRDVYASGTTPTTGAEIVYKLATPTTIPQQPEVIRMLQGTNNIYADCGEVLEGEYFVDEGAHRYQLYDYIESDGTQVIDLGFAPTNGSTVTTSFVLLSTQTSEAFVYGATDNSAWLGFAQNPASRNTIYENNTSGRSESYIQNQQYLLTLTASRDYTNHLCMFGFYLDGYAPGIKTRLCYCKYNDNFYLPAKRKSDGVFGLYDVTNQTFLTDSAGGNAFVGGNPIGVGV